MKFMRSVLHTGEVVRPWTFNFANGSFKGINLGVTDIGHSFPIVTMGSKDYGITKEKVIEVDSQRAREYGFKIIVR